MHEMEQPSEVLLALRLQGDIAGIWSGAVPAGHSHGAAHVCAGDKRWPLQPSHLPPVQGANAGERLCTNIHVHVFQLPGCTPVALRAPLAHTRA